MKAKAERVRGGVLTVGDVLWGNGIEELRPNGNAEICQIAQQLASKTETLVDLEGAVDVGVVDKSFPSNGRAGFLHDVIEKIRV